MLLSDTGQLYTWGSGLATGHGRRGSRIPALVPTLEDEQIVEVSCSVSHTMCATSNGVVYMWYDTQIDSYVWYRKILICANNSVVYSWHNAFINR